MPQFLFSSIEWDWMHGFKHGVELLPTTGLSLADSLDPGFRAKREKPPVFIATTLK